MKLISWLKRAAAWRRHRRAPLWADGAPLREALFGIERLEKHAETLACAQPVAAPRRAAPPLSRRLDANTAAIHAVHRSSAAIVARGAAVAPAAEWLLDNHHIVAEQIREIRESLPPGYYRQLPKLASGPFVGYPRVFGIAWAFVAHTDSHFDPEALRRFVVAYQRVAPLTIGELWALAITLRIVLVENLRRLADQIAEAHDQRALADKAADLMLGLGGRAAQPPAGALAAFGDAPIPDLFASQLAKRLRGADPSETPAHVWLDERLRRHGACIDDVVRRAQDRQMASNVSMRNVITSMRLISDADWPKLVETVSLVDERLRACPTYAAMDFATRNAYRTAIEDIARHCRLSEIELASRAVAMAAQPGASAADADPAHAARRRDPGWLLVGGGRRAFERAVGFRAPPARGLGRAFVRCGVGGYVGAVIAATALVLGLGLWLAAEGAPTAVLATLAVLGLLPAMQAANVLVDRAVNAGFGPTALPGLELIDGPPQRLRTLVAMPTLLSDAATVAEQVEQLEVHHLGAGGGEFYFALLSDAPDAPTETTPEDAPLLAAAAAAIATLNRRHPAGAAGPRFMLLHRRRVFAPLQGCWMGWERKRGKLHELNRLLRGARDTTFVAIDGAAPIPPQGVRYVLTLDADTRLPRGAARKLIGKMAHPLNVPTVDPCNHRVTEGHAVMQPRVTPSLPMRGAGSTFQRVYSSPGGMDAYATVVSDVWQDLFGQGAYAGKGAYDVDAFSEVMEGRTPTDAVLSHDLFEGVFARAAFVSDVEIVEDHPARYDVAAKRTHRWTRGDWQLTPWLFGAQRNVRGGVPRLGRLRMADTLRRSLLAPLALAALGVGWTLAPAAALAWSAFILATLALPALIPIPFAILPVRAGATARSHVAALGRDLRLALARTALDVTFLPDAAWRTGDAIARALHRLLISRRHLLEWVSAAQADRAARLTPAGFYRRMAGGTALGLGACGAALAAAPGSALLIAPFAALWLAAPVVALRISRPSGPATQVALRPADARALRLIGRRTWRYFETFATAQENLLPPDNFQEDPRPVVAHRTSPTNIGLYLLSSVAARDFGWAGSLETVERLEATLAVVDRMARFRGHLLNWYDTRDLRVLDPPYVSSVDSGNLAGHLIALANACDSAAQTPIAPAMVAQGVADCAALAREDADAAFWTDAAARTAAEHQRDAAPGLDLADRWLALGARARTMAMAMDFTFLLDPERKLLSIGFSVNDNSRDAGCYDLLASEARLASLFAIAKGDAPTKHWFRLGRSATPVGDGAALLSWSGSMFEYLMPSLVMRAPADSLLERANRLAVAAHRAHGRAAGLPWGVSESAFNARDIEFTYQYSNFGVASLGLKRGLRANAVVAPYATALAAMVDPAAAVRNFARLAALGGLGRHGFYEALDFTPARLPEGATVAVVRAYMAHHQGMSIVSIANALLDGVMRARFHAEPIVMAAELLLQERPPREVSIARPIAGDNIAAPPPDTAAAIRSVTRPDQSPPASHLLSNGAYGVMLTAAGSGYSRWRGLAVTRWREDATRDASGGYIYLRDVESGAVWSAGFQPTCVEPDRYEACFAEDGATITRRDGRLTTITEVFVSPEDDAEVRRVSLVNRGRRARLIALTSCAEIVLAPPAADAAHPAFSKLFVHTERLEEARALVATRRRRALDEPEAWAAHLAVVEGVQAGAGEFETDRARFLGRGRDARDPAALYAPLSGTVGAVLDPVFSLRRRVRVPPGGVARVAFWTMAAPDRAKLLDLIDRHHEPSAFDRVQTLAWTQAQVQLRHLGVSPGEAADFQALAAHIVHPERALRPASDTIVSGAAAQSGLWRFGISGDAPIVMLSIEDIEDIAQVRQLLRAHEYWRMKQLAVDLVIVNTRTASYAQDLQTAIETAVRSARARPAPGAAPAPGEVFTLRADLAGEPALALLRSVARVVLLARRGPIDAQLARVRAKAAARATARTRVGAAAMPAAAPVAAQAARRDRAAPPAPADPPAFFNGLGGFDKDGREYVAILDGGRTTPTPWVNVVANPGFGFHVSADGAGATWSLNSRENQLTPWSNDPVSDPCGEALYVRDEETGALWGPTAAPLRDGGRHVARHGFGYSRFEHEAHGVALALTLFVSVADPVKIMRLTLRNRTDRARKLTVTAYAELVMGAARAATAPHLQTAIDAATGAMIARNPWSAAFPGRVAFIDIAGRQTAWTADRTAFLGRNGALADPAALRPGAALDGATGAGLDPCAALQAPVALAPGETAEIVVTLGEAADAAAARALALRWRGADLDAEMAAVSAQWTEVLGAVQVKTPDRAMDVMLNGWLMYQTLACRVWARAGFWQASGAYGFRDQLQDGMALTLARPDLTRSHLLRAAGRQFPEGDVQHWWLPHSGQGVRTRISDDRVWLAYAAAAYVRATGDEAVLKEQVGFLDGPLLKDGAHDAFFQPEIADETATLFEHCARGLDQCVRLTAANGMPLIGGGDWNDGMNLVGAQGRGASVWLGWLFIATVARFAPLAEARDPARAARWRAHAASVRDAIEREGWDGAWYRRGTYDDGAALGSATSEECRIDSIAQSWAVLSGAGDPARAAQAMDAVAAQLIRRDAGLALLFAPPFDRTTMEPGYIKGYPPGVRENGGQYSHAAMWSVMAFARLGRGDEAAALFALLNPINHALTASAVARYKLEPYVIAADVYGVAPHEGRGGWSWYTGSAGWMQRAGVESILGVMRRGADLRVAPCIPAHWPGFSVTLTLPGMRWEIVVENPGHVCRGVAAATLDGRDIAVEGDGVTVALTEGAHALRLTLGAACAGGPSAR